MFAFDKRQDTQLTFGGFSYQSPHLTRDGDVVFTEYDFCQFPWVSRILFYHDGMIEPISDGHTQPQVPDINNRRQIVWDSAGNGRGYVWMWQDGQISRLTDDGGVPTINDQEHVTFWRWFNESEQYQTLLFRDGWFFQLTMGSFDYFPHSLDNFGEVAIRVDYGGLSSDVLLLRRQRQGDGNGDKHVDLTDYAAFEACMTGPRWSSDHGLGPENTLCECRFEDLNHDNNVDLVDYAMLVNRFTTGD